jgi:hypothetical protein
MSDKRIDEIKKDVALFKTTGRATFEISDVAYLLQALDKANAMVTEYIELSAKHSREASMTKELNRKLANHNHDYKLELDKKDAMIAKCREALEFTVKESGTGSNYNKLARDTLAELETE